MLKATATTYKKLFETGFRRGDAWFFLANALQPFIALALGPFILKKVGLEEYALLGLATYFFNLVTGYSDFSGSTHLLAIYSKKSPNRNIDLANVFALKAMLLTLFFFVLLFFIYAHPRKDNLYGLLALFMAYLLLPVASIEWYFISRKLYLQFFLARTSFMSIQIILIMGWFFSHLTSALFVPSTTWISGLVGSLCLVGFLGKDKILGWLSAMRKVSFHGIRSLVFRLFPMAATLLVTPYFMAYALPWYSLTNPDKKLMGVFSISYRLIMGISALVAPLVIYSIARAASNHVVSFRKAFSLSLLVSLGFWIAGVGVLWFYFHVAKVDMRLFLYSARVFSILMGGIFFLCLRTPYVGRWVASGRYRGYFFMHLVACSPVLLFSWIAGAKISSSWIPWLACLPDLLATTGFVFYSRFRFRPSEVG